MNFIKEIKSKLLSQQTKTVYRYVTDEELEFFLSEDTSMLGSKYKGEKLSNSHKYKDEEYLHFFDTQNLPTRVLNSLPGEKTHICSFEIDKHTLNKYRGEGYYPPQGYDLDYTSIKEYAIPVNEYQPNWFIGATPLKNNDMQPTTSFDTQPPIEQ
ncbi:MAG: hypothetical protein IJB10_05060 [Clostridia bacterium]|nr:hypothetical protein [Clostridia bacterium]